MHIRHLFYPIYNPSTKSVLTPPYLLLDCSIEHRIASHHAASQSMQQRITKDAFINVDDDEGLAKQEVSVSLDQLMENEFKVTNQRNYRMHPLITHITSHSLSLS